MNTTPLNVLDIFSGAGGFSQGFSDVGFTIAGAIEKDHDSCLTFKGKSPATEVFEGDAASFCNKLTVKQLPPIDLIIGGPPCQGFSSVNIQRDVNHPGNNCVLIYLKYIEIIRPPFIVMENVTGLLTLGNGFALKAIIDYIKELEYDCEYRVLQAADYGVPQERWRLIFVAYKKGMQFSFPSPTHLANVRLNFSNASKLVVKDRNENRQKLFHHTTVWDAISDLPEIENGSRLQSYKYTSQPNSNYQSGLRLGSTKITNHSTKRLEALQMSRVLSLKEPGQCWQDLPDELKPQNLIKLQKNHGSNCWKRFRRLLPSEMFSTIVTEPNPYWGAFIHPYQDRVLSVREFARAQSFPDYIEFFGTLRSQYRQVGNAVPCLLAKSIAMQVKQSFVTL
jgi:DNA (cytosine-5)-methyltransferase 1